MNTVPMPETPDKTIQKVLMVDDTPMYIATLRGILSELGCQLLAASDGTEGLEIIRRERPDLVLLDVMMPGMNGFQVCEALKQDPLTQDISVIFLTACTDTEDIVKGFEAGAVDYVGKPFNAEELLARVKTHLALKAARDSEKCLIEELQMALTKVKMLSGLIPICAKCKKIRNDEGYWSQVEEYIGHHSEASFSHGLCPDCIGAFFPEYHARHAKHLEESLHPKTT